MLFNSYIFIFAFLPFSLLVYHMLRHFDMKRGAVFSLTLLSLFFYGWWNPIYLLLLIPLTLINFLLARWILFCNSQSAGSAKSILVLGIAMNVGVLGYFKYANFLVDNINTLFGLNLFLAQIVLPLGISFFTFQKIAFLVDADRGKVDKLNLLDFSLFVSFFPQLIAGPIVHHSEVLPQFKQRGKIPADYITMGVTIFTLGLMKKVLIADTAALYAAPTFNAISSNMLTPGFITAWSAALAYTVQLYFDFSGYSDMAIGIGLLFGIRLPVNFDSPYKAASIIDFWRRWHITLSRFLRDYLYISLGGNRRGKARRHMNLLLTMLLGGLWHGANWTFVVWGGLHGTYLMINHFWRFIRGQIDWLPKTIGSMERFLGHALTFIAIVIAWVFFRAADLDTAFIMLKAMAGANGLGVYPPNSEGLTIACALLLVTWFAPNTQEITGYVGPSGTYGEGAIPKPLAWLRWQPTFRWAVVMGGVLAISIMSLSRISEFIYFQF